MDPGPFHLREGYAGPRLTSTLTSFVAITPFLNYRVGNPVNRGNTRQRPFVVSVKIVATEGGYAPAVLTPQDWGRTRKGPGLR